MLIIETKYGNFGGIKDILLFMNDENLKEIEFLKVEYCLDEIIGKGIYTLEQIESTVNEINK